MEKTYVFRSWVVKTLKFLKYFFAVGGLVGFIGLFVTGCYTGDDMRFFVTLSVVSILMHAGIYISVGIQAVSDRDDEKRKSALAMYDTEGLIEACNEMSRVSKATGTSFENFKKALSRAADICFTAKED